MGGHRGPLIGDPECIRRSAISLYVVALPTLQIAPQMAVSSATIGGMKPAVILLSGGLDSATVLAEAKAAGYECYALSFDYGQRHRHELNAAAELARQMGVLRHVTAQIDMRAFGGSALTADIPVPKDQPVIHAAADASHSGEAVPITYVPARNTVFLSFALAWAEVLGAFDIFIGVNALDYSGYPDCRPEFIAAFEKLANVATAAGEHGAFKIHAPLAALTKAQIIQRGTELRVPFALTHSCYDPVTDETGQVRACGHCDSCQLRRQGFAEAGVADPTKYAAEADV
jgi:7-cyano-7-deazaguanine synthase